MSPLTTKPGSNTTVADRAPRRPTAPGCRCRGGRRPAARVRPVSCRAAEWAPVRGRAPRERLRRRPIRRRPRRAPRGRPARPRRPVRTACSTATRRSRGGVHRRAHRGGPACLSTSAATVSRSICRSSREVMPVPPAPGAGGVLGSPQAECSACTRSSHSDRSCSEVNPIAPWVCSAERAASSAASEAAALAALTSRAVCAESSAKRQRRAEHQRAGQLHARCARRRACA